MYNEAEELTYQLQVHLFQKYTNQRKLLFIKVTIVSEMTRVLLKHWSRTLLSTMYYV